MPRKTEITHCTPYICAACLCTEVESTMEARALPGFGIVMVCANPTECRQRWEAVEEEAWSEYYCSDDR